MPITGLVTYQPVFSQCSQKGTSLVFVINFVIKLILWIQVFLLVKYSVRYKLTLFVLKFLYHAVNCVKMSDEPLTSRDPQLKR